jgi:hypothetical protein
VTTSPSRLTATQKFADGHDTEARTVLNKFGADQALADDVPAPDDVAAAKFVGRLSTTYETPMSMKQVTNRDAIFNERRLTLKLAQSVGRLWSVAIHLA